MQVKYMPIGLLKEYENNSRTHSDDQIKRIVNSIKEFGFTNPVLITADNVVVAGHARVRAAKEAKLVSVPTITVDWNDPDKIKAYVIADNQLATRSAWDFDLLKSELQDLNTSGFDLSLIGFDDGELDGLLKCDSLPDPLLNGGEDDTPPLPEEPTTKRGDVWKLGKHRVMCGDSTCADDVKKLMKGVKADLLHADPPYGMGKEKDGVLNDNLTGGALLDFQMTWWQTWRKHITDSASIYIWGNAEHLWELWFKRLEGLEEITLENEIVWDKNDTAGMGSPLNIKYSCITERCLFMKLGKVFRGSINAEDFIEGYAPVLEYLEFAFKNSGASKKDIQDLTKTSMYGHWFTKSQFTLIPEKHYRVLQKTYPQAFDKPWRELKKQYDKVPGVPNRGQYFNNTHDAAGDVWRERRVTGEERHGHATPKPIAIMERIMKSSLKRKGICVEPFGGSGSTLIGAERTGRACYTMELDPRYVDVIIKRWEDLTGKKAETIDRALRYEESLWSQEYDPCLAPKKNGNDRWISNQP